MPHAFLQGTEGVLIRPIPVPSAASRLRVYATAVADSAAPDYVDVAVAVFACPNSMQLQASGESCTLLTSTAGAGVLLTSPDSADSAHPSTAAEANSVELALTSPGWLCIEGEPPREGAAATQVLVTSRKNARSHVVKLAVGPNGLYTSVFFDEGKAGWAVEKKKKESCVLLCWGVVLCVL